MFGSDADLTLGTRSTIGRYFGIVSAVPSLILGVWVYALLVMRPWSGEPRLDALETTNPFDRPTHGIALVLFALVTAVVVHPLQFLATQALEGYWGAGPIGRALQVRRIFVHLRRRDRFLDQEDRAADAAESLGTRLPKTANGTTAWPDSLNHPDFASFVGACAERDASTAALLAYPTQEAETMPTRLGNMLRRHESASGRAVGLSAIGWASHIGMVADPQHTAYLQDQRNALDLAVRMTVTGGTGFAITFILLWPDGAWVLLALVPLTASWLSYRGAVSAADSYGRALTAWVHLNRFRLYEALGLPPVGSAAEERAQNRALDDLLLGNPEYTAGYRHKDGPNA